ncbi:plasmid replication protein RepC [Marinovum sp.]|uniref:plasmid replication protein RepC n=1 Tax=Marinovum sp. TaxID=2024839 RepID=UPI002B27351F|nr:plasmid replication protein RepC [Marinovum sp.]
MAFIQASAPHRARTGNLLSADNALPERHVLIETLRTAAPRLGLGAPVLATLDAMLSCLPPKRNHHTVFASNATLTFRRNGISDRTIRRHAAALQEAGLLVRRDSPNRKRFTRHNGAEGKALRFGFDLTPLFDRLQEIARHAAEVMQERESLAYLRAKLRAAVHTALSQDPGNAEAETARRALRRKLTLADCETLLETLAPADVVAEAEDDEKDVTATVTASDGQIVRHHHRSNKELIDKKAPAAGRPPSPTKAPEAISVRQLLAACPEAAQFAPRQVETPGEVVTHARTLAPMIGVTDACYKAAEHRHGVFGAAVTIWAMMQFHDRIASAGAYFRTITTGAKSGDFDPARLVRRLAQSQNVPA